MSFQLKTFLAVLTLSLAFLGQGQSQNLPSVDASGAMVLAPASPVVPQPDASAALDYTAWGAMADRAEAVIAAPASTTAAKRPCSSRATCR